MGRTGVVSIERDVLKPHSAKAGLWLGGGWEVLSIQGADKLGPGGFLTPSPGSCRRQACLLFSASGRSPISIDRPPPWTGGKKPPGAEPIPCQARNRSAGYRLKTRGPREDVERIRQRPLLLEGIQGAIGCHPARLLRDVPRQGKGPQTCSRSGPLQPASPAPGQEDLRSHPIQHLLSTLTDHSRD